MLAEDVVEFATARNYAAFTSILPSGFPMTHVVWVDADDECILINTQVGRQKYSNVMREQRVSVTIMDAENPYRFIELRGRVVETVEGQWAHDHVDRLSQRYTGAPYDPAAVRRSWQLDERPDPATERVVLRISPEQVLRWPRQRT